MKRDDQAAAGLAGGCSARRRWAWRRRRAAPPPRPVARRCSVPPPTGSCPRAGVEMRVSAGVGPDSGPALRIATTSRPRRLAAARRTVAIELPPRYELRFQLRGGGAQQPRAQARRRDGRQRLWHVTARGVASRLTPLRVKKRQITSPGTDADRELRVPGRWSSRSPRRRAVAHPLGGRFSSWCHAALAESAGRRVPRPTSRSGLPGGRRGGRRRAHRLAAGYDGGAADPRPRRLASSAA